MMHGMAWQGTVRIKSQIHAEGVQCDGNVAAQVCAVTNNQDVMDRYIGRMKTIDAEMYRRERESGEETGGSAQIPPKGEFAIGAAFTGRFPGVPRRFSGCQVL